MRRKKKYPPLTPMPNETQQVKADVPEGFSVHERIVRGKTPRGEEVEIARGFILAYNDGKLTRYAGRTLTWQPKAFMVDAMYKTQQLAEEAAARCRKTWQEISAFNDRKFPIRDVVISTPFADTNGDTSRRSMATQLHGRLTIDETHTVEAMRLALRQVNAEYTPGRPVVTAFDAIRWMLSQLAVSSVSPVSSVSERK